ncbi:MAG: IclR family transcriptional regulator [Subtercola sp.]|nr:IclR family transcriptional regulator [Subtercola sp.]
MTDGLLVRAVSVLRVFSSTRPSLTLTEICALAGLPRSTTQRLLMQLLDVELLTRVDDRYTISTALWEIGELAPVSLRLRERALPYLNRLYEATGENVHLAVLDGFDALYVARVVGPNAVPTLSRMGGRHPLHTTGVGKALLALQNEEFLTAFFARQLEAPTMYSITSQSALREELTAIARDGYSRTSQEMTLGNVSLAVPIVTGPNLPLAAVGVVTHLARSNPSRTIPLLKKMAEEISAQLRELE